jgi:hypothetical protein
MMMNKTKSNFWESLLERVLMRFHPQNLTEYEVELMVILILDCWSQYKEVHACSPDKYWTFIGEYFIGIINSSNRLEKINRRNDFFAVNRRTDNFILLQEPEHHYIRFLSLAKIICESMESIRYEYEYENNHNYSDISSVDYDWEGPLSLKHHMSVCYQPIDPDKPTLLIFDRLAEKFMFNVRDYPHSEVGRWDFTQYMLLKLKYNLYFPRSLGDFYDNRMSIARKSRLTKRFDERPDIIISLDIVYLCFIDELNMIFLEFSKTYGN